jgi:hypothetical protein
MDVPTCDEIFWIKIMPIHNETGRAGGAARLGENAFPGGNCKSENATKPEVLQEENLEPITYEPQEFPSFFQLVTENAEAPIRRATVYLRILAELSSVEDCEGYREAGKKFLDAGREIAKQLALLETPKVFSNEAADRLEEKALALHNLADLTEMQASRHRQVVLL